MVDVNLVEHAERELALWGQTAAENAARNALLGGPTRRMTSVTDTHGTR